MKYLVRRRQEQRKRKFKEIVNRIRQCLRSPIAVGETGFLRINGFMVKIERVGGGRVIKEELGQEV